MPVAVLILGVNKIKLNNDGSISSYSSEKLSDLPSQVNNHRLVITKSKMFLIGGRTSSGYNLSHPVTTIKSANYEGFKIDYTEQYNKLKRQVDTSSFALPNRNSSSNPKYNTQNTQLSYYIYPGTINP